MSNFYDGWLGFWDDEKQERAEAKKFIHEEELEWVRTKQDYRVALTCSRENGFITAGAMMVAEIPKGWHTGKHSHGEEAIFILDGEGFTVVDGKRYDWDTGSCLFMPYGSIHQHFNSGDRGVRYLSAMGLALERFAGLARVIQYEEAGQTYVDEMEDVEKAESDIHPEYGRIVLRQKDAAIIFRKDVVATEADKTDLLVGAAGHHNREVELMLGDKNGFKAKEVMMTFIMCDEPGKTSGKHGHMEALIYILQGEGYSIIDGNKVEWKKGTTLHVQGPHVVHQHFNTGKVESQMLRTHYGLRWEYFQSIASRVFPSKRYKPEAISSLDETK